MEKILVEKEIKVFCVTAKSYPEGIMDAHAALNSLVPFSAERRYFGISRPEKLHIIYKAAAEETYNGESKKLGCESFVIKSGQYISIFIKDYLKDIQSIGKAFEKLIVRPDIDPDGYCVEWYINEKDVRCMVRLIR